MSVLKHVVESLFGGPRVLIEDLSSKNGYGSLVAVWKFEGKERLSSRLMVVSQDTVLVFGDNDEFDLKKPYAITVIQGGKVTRFKPVYAVWREQNRQADRVKRARNKLGSEFGSNFLFSTNREKTGSDYTRLVQVVQGVGNRPSQDSEEDALALFESLANKKP